MKVCFAGTTGHYGYALSAILKDPDLTIVGVAPGHPDEDMSTRLVKAMKDNHLPVAYFNDYIEMLDTVHPDILVANSFFGVQASIAAEGLRRGIHVFCEKPIATNMEDLAKLRSVYDASSVRLCAMFGIRFDPWFMTAYHYVNAGFIGEVRLLHGQKSYKLGTRGPQYKSRALYGGTIPWVGSHAVDWIYKFSGRRFETVAAAHSTACNNDHGDLEATAVCMFTLTGGVVATASIDYMRPEAAPSHGDDRIRVVGSLGVLEVRDSEIILIDKDGSRVIPNENCPGIFADFVDSIRTDRPAFVTPEDSFYITEACLRAREAADTGKIVRF